ncbi:uncharacterized protein LOC116027125 [Ipomoea triloba]|uniref:uncharacterized protein LOC116027125 n=1 Tax=Ipomoea triloba TaxID=35885 RepID=UPI00125E274F|nr:uncharacterized protein LOC116027125 [Ipomoea triloba]
MMQTNSKGDSGKPPSIKPPNTHLECCMCGDHGLSLELFRCKLCQFRSQHRYCSNLYPKAESYGVCNWCLTVEKGEEAQNSSNSSSSCRNSGEENDGKIRKKFGGNNIRMGGSCLRLKNAPPKLQVKNRPVLSKQKSVSPESSPAAVKGVAAAAGMEERLRRTKSDSGIVRHVFRNKVRRYKLLDEVSSQ